MQWLKNHLRKYNNNNNERNKKKRQRTHSNETWTKFNWIRTDFTFGWNEYTHTQVTIHTYYVLFTIGGVSACICYKQIGSDQEMPPDPCSTHNWSTNFTCLRTNGESVASIFFFFIRFVRCIQWIHTLNCDVIYNTEEKKTLHSVDLRMYVWNQHVFLAKKKL